MTKNNVINHVNRQIQKLHFKMHKKKKNWIVLGVSVLALGGGLGAVSLSGSASKNIHLPVAPKITTNYLAISQKTGLRGVHQSHFDKPQGYSPINFHEYLTAPQTGRYAGSPLHRRSVLFHGRYINVPHYESSDISSYHGSLEKENLQDKSGSSKVMMADINPKHVPKAVKVTYPDSANVAIPYKTKNGGTKFHRQKLNVGVVASDIHLYKPWGRVGSPYGGNHASILFSHNLHHGIWYNGITSMHIRYFFQNPKTQKPMNLTHSYMQFNSLEPLSYHNYPDSFPSSTRHGGQDSSINNLFYVQGVNKPSVDGHKRMLNPTGESVIVNKGKNEWTASGPTGSDPTIVQKYDSHGLFSGPLGNKVIGGVYRATRHGHGSVNDSVVSPISGSSIDVDASTSVGYGYFNPKTKIHVKPQKGKVKKHKRHNPKPGPGSNTTGLTKYLSGIQTNSNGSMGHITHRNQTFDYNLKGKLPYRTWRNSYHVHHYTTQRIIGYKPEHFTFNGHYYHWDDPIYTYDTHYFRTWYDGHKDDHYNVTDNLPKDVRVNGDDSSVSDSLGVPVQVSWNGDHQVIHMKLDNNQMDEYSKQNFHIKIPVIANNLPQDSSMTDSNADSNTDETKNYDSSNYYAGKNSSHNGSNRPVDNTDTINSKGWYKFWNGDDANGGTNADEQVYTSVDRDGGFFNDPDKKFTSNKVGVKIRKIRYFVNHFDYGSDNGDFIPTDEVNNGGYNDQYHANNSNTLAKYMGYGFEGDHVPIKILNQNNGNASYKGYDNGTGVGNDNALYRFGYGNYDWVFPTLGYGSDNGADNSTNQGGMTEHFWKPYVAPHAKITHMGRFMVATDKKDNKLPYRLDLKSDAYLYQDQWLEDNFGGDNINVNITSNGTTVAHKSVPLTEFLNETHHGKKLFEFSGKLDTTGLNVHAGDRVPLNVQVSFSDPTQAQLEGISTNTHAWISSEHNMTGKDFKGSHKDTAKFKEPERTIKYFSDGEDDNPRTMFEELVMKQPHDGATAKTGYGLRSNLSIDYFGHINAKRYGSNGTDTDYAFPQSWADKDSNIKYKKNPYNDDIVNPNDSDTSTNGKSVSQMENWDRANREHGFVGNYSSYNFANDADRLAHNHVQWNSGYSALDGQGLDSVDDMGNGGYDKYVDSQFGNTISGLKSNGMPDGDTPGHYGTEFHFYPRAVMRDSGVVQLQHDEDITNNNSDGFSDGFTANNATGSTFMGWLDNGKSISNVNNDRMYTPFWLPLGYYNTSFEKAMPSNSRVGNFNGDVESAPESFDSWYDNSNDKRLGGNFFNFEDNMFDQMVGHEYLADNSKSESKDELSLQPVLGGTKHNGNGQNVKGFSQADNDWIHFHDGWENFFNK